MLKPRYGTSSVVFLSENSSSVVGSVTPSLQVVIYPYIRIYFSIYGIYIYRKYFQDAPPAYESLVASTKQHLASWSKPFRSFAKSHWLHLFEFSPLCVWNVQIRNWSFVKSLSNRSFILLTVYFCHKIYTDRRRVVEAGNDIAFLADKNEVT